MRDGGVVMWFGFKICFLVFSAPDKPALSSVPMLPMRPPTHRCPRILS